MAPNSLIKGDRGAKKTSCTCKVVNQFNSVWNTSNCNNATDRLTDVITLRLTHNCHLVAGISTTSHRVSELTPASQLSTSCTTDRNAFNIKLISIGRA